MKRQKNTEKIVPALNSTLTTCLLLLQCYGIMALKVLRDRSQLSYIVSEALLSGSMAIARFKRMESRQAITLLVDR